MNKKSYRVWEYEKMVWRKALKDTFEFYKTDWRAWLISVMPVIVALVARRYLGGLAEEITSISIGVAGALLAALFILIVHRMSAPVVLYRVIESKANKYTWDDISVIIAKLKPHNEPTVLLDVLNNKPFDIQNATVRLTSLQKDRFPVVSHRLPLNLCWEDDKGVIRGKDSWSGRKLYKNGERRRALSIATWSAIENAPVITTGHPKQNQVGVEEYIQIDLNSTYTLHLEWFGEVDGQPMETYETEYSLKFDGSNFDLRKLE
jgi:hypothetical protein